MAVQTQYRVPQVEGTKAGETLGQRRTVVIGVLIMLALIAAVLAAGRVVANRSTPATSADGTLSATTIGTRTPAFRDDTGAWLHRGAAAVVPPTDALTRADANAKAVVPPTDALTRADANAANRPDTMTRADANAKAVERRDAAYASSGTHGIQSGYGDTGALSRHFSPPPTDGAHDPGVILRRQPHTVT